MTTKLTEFQAKVLTKIHDEPGIAARELSEYLWPDSIAHRRVYNTGTNGACRGKGAWLTAGSHVGKLIKKGWARHRNTGYWNNKRKKTEYYFSGYDLTRAGKDVLAEHLT